eukprot:GHVP01036962.1.p2 GENE.GHVP01036962.1~~GHVP01036962.1.p2  ORF type:complete len:123 (-),score=8.93 GHVP01036962.1:167-535(-)
MRRTYKHISPLCGCTFFFMEIAVRAAVQFLCQGIQENSSTVVPWIQICRTCWNIENSAPVAESLLVEEPTTRYTRADDGCPFYSFCFRGHLHRRHRTPTSVREDSLSTCSRRPQHPLVGNLC